jgi:HlyD family secretion protein
MNRTLIIILLIIVLAGGGYFVYTRYQQAQTTAQSSFQTVALKKGNLTATIGASGTVRPYQTTTLNWQISGRVAKVNVKEGDKVSVNQILAELDASTLSPNLILARSDLITAKRNLDNLKNSDVTRTQAQSNLLQAEKTLEDAKTNRYSSELAPVSKAVLDQKQADLLIAQDFLKKRQEDFTKFEKLSENDPIRARFYSPVIQAQQKVDQIENDLAWLTSLPDPVEVAKADAAIVVAQAKLNDAQREWDRLKNGPDPQDIIAAQAKVDSIEATLAQTQIKAPISGTVTDIRSMPGDQVNAGTVGFRIDDFSHQLVDVQITEVDINRVKLNQLARVSFDAIQKKEYNGKVVEISTFGTASGGVVNFTVTVELTDADAQVRAGMTASINLTVEQLNDILLVPNRAVRLRSGQRIVYVLENGLPKSVDITLGATSDTSSQLIKGDVKENDEIVLNPPASAFSAGPGGFGGMGGR